MQHPIALRLEGQLGCLPLPTHRLLLDALEEPTKHRKQLALDTALVHQPQLLSHLALTELELRASHRLSRESHRFEDAYPLGSVRVSKLLRILELHMAHKLLNHMAHL